MIIAIDFDGTITKTHEYPAVGKINEKAIEVLKKLQQKGHILCLWTCREGKELHDAVKSLYDEGIIFDYINNAPYSESRRKIVADIYIDDRNFGGFNWDDVEKELCKNEL